MAELKTQPTGASVEEFLEAIPDEARRNDCRAVVKIMRKVTKAPPRMWGPSIVGFGDYRYQSGSGSGKETAWFLTGFASRKQALTLYIMTGFPRHAELMRRLGKYQNGKTCLLIKRLSDVDLDVLEELVRESVSHMQRSDARDS